MKNCKSKKIRLGFYTIPLKSKIIFCWFVFLVVLFIVLFVVFLVVFLVVLRYDDYRVFIYSTHIYSPFCFLFGKQKKDCWRSPLELDRVNVFSFAWCLPSFFYDLMMIDIEWLVLISVDVIDKANNRQRKHKCLKKCHRHHLPRSLSVREEIFLISSVYHTHLYFQYVVAKKLFIIFIHNIYYFTINTPYPN